MGDRTYYTQVYCYAISMLLRLMRRVVLRSYRLVSYTGNNNQRHYEQGRTRTTYSLSAIIFRSFWPSSVDSDHVESRPLGTFHSPDGPKQQTTLIQGYTNSIQEFSRCTDHVLKRLKATGIADNFIDDCGVTGNERERWRRNSPTGYEWR